MNLHCNFIDCWNIAPAGQQLLCVVVGITLVLTILIVITKIAE